MQSNIRRIIENFLSLSLLNGINLIIPLITLPYLIKTIGIEYYGAYSVVYAMIQYAIIISSYGFNYSSTQQISRKRNNLSIINNIFNSVIFSRIGIGIIVTILLTIISIFFFPTNYLCMLLLGVGMIFGDILNPVWLYQGMEQMKYMTIINFASKSVFTILIFLFIREQSDYLYVTLLNSIGYLVAGLLSCWFASKTFQIHLSKPSKRYISHQMKSGWHIFLSTISMTLYRNSNIFILSFFVGEGAVGIYSGAEKIIKAIQGAITPISTALFPFIAKSFAKISVVEQINKIIKLGVIIGIILVLVSFFTYLLAPYINRILLDNVATKATSLIRLMIPVIFFGCLNYVLGIVGLINMDQKIYFSRSVMISGFVSVLFLLITVHFWGIISAAISMVLTEILLFAFCTNKLYKIHQSC